MLKKKINLQILILMACVLVVCYLALIPVGMLLFNSFRSLTPDGTKAFFTIRNYIQAYLDPEFYPLMRNSVVYGIGSCLLTFFIGTTLAWIFERTNTPLKKVFAVMALVPFIIPGILSTISWILLLSPKIGMVNLVLMRILGLEKAPLNVYSMYGMIWTQGVHNYPLIFLMMAAAFRSMDMVLEESATMSGSGTFSTFYHITLPLMRPAIISTMLIIFIRTIESFSVPAVIGLPAGIEVFTSKIWVALQGYPPNFGLTSSLAVTLLIISVAGIFCYRYLTKKGERFATVTGKGYRPRVIDLGRAKYLISAGCILFFLFSIGFPVLTVLWCSLIPYYEAPSLSALSKISLKNYIFVFKVPMTMRAFLNSIFLMLATPTVTMLLTSVIAWISVKSKIKGKAFLDMTAFVPIAIPGIVLGVSLMYVYLTVPIPIYGTIWILLVAYTTKYMPFGIRATTTSIIQIHNELEEASALSGGSWIQTFRRITLPLLIPGFIAGWLYIAMVSLRELSTSILLYSSKSVVLSIVVFDLLEGGEFSEISALGIIMIIILVILASVANKVGARIGIKRLS